MHVVSSVFVFIAYALVLTFVAVRARTARKFSEFSLARRALPLALVFGSLSATYVGPGFSIGFVGKGFNSGFLFLAIGVAYAVQNILVGLLVAVRAPGDARYEDETSSGDDAGDRPRILFNPAARAAEALEERVPSRPRRRTRVRLESGVDPLAQLSQ